jgi:hypothetical protein
MVFSLEALAALHGDSLLLHFGEQGAPQTILIDGGPARVYPQTLQPRLDELRGQLVAAGALKDGAPLALPLAMVSHIDDDHIGGMLALAQDVDTDQADGRAPWLTIGAFWLNTFEDVAAQSGDGAAFSAEDQQRSKTAAVVASVKQGRKLHALVEKLWPLNTDPFGGGLVQAPAQGGALKQMPNGLSLLVVSPQADDIATFRKEWDEQIKKLLKGTAKPAEVAEAVDDSPFNLSSIVVVARMGDRSMLLTGDANGDHVRAGLAAADQTDASGRAHFDLLKLPHHGSRRNVDLEFFQKLTADHYVISADGKYDNPDSPTLEWIVTARTTVRKDQRYTIHLTYEGLPDNDLHERLTAFRAEHPGVDLQVRPAADRSLRIDLGDPPFAP